MQPSSTSVRRAAAHAAVIAGCVMAAQLSTTQVAFSLVEAPPPAWVLAVATSPRDFLLTADEAGEAAELVTETDGVVDLGQWARRRWERDRDTSDVRIGPVVLDNTVYLARDVDAARELFGRQVSRQVDFPEATDAHVGPFEFAIVPVGDEVAGLSACEDCLADETINLHHRVVVRKGPVVSVVYLYGRERVATQDLATWFAVQAASRVPDGLVAEGLPPNSPGEALTAPSADPGSGTAPGPAIQGQPRDFAVTLDEAGKWAELVDEQAGADDRVAWYAVRYERPRDYAGFRSGPVTVASRVFVARDEQTARQVLDEQALLNEQFPEATEEVGDRFELEVGDEQGPDERGLSACTGSCNSREEIYVHKRLVSRVGTVVSVVYIWGLDDPEGATDWHARYFASLVDARSRLGAAASSPPDAS